MTLNVLFAAQSDLWADYEAPLAAALAEAGLDARLDLSIPAAEVDYIIYSPDSELQDFAPYRRAKAVLNLWAGVEKTVGNPTLVIPFARMVDPAMTTSMTEWVCGHVLRYHLGMDADIVNPDRTWGPRVPPLAAERRVCVLGLGELGTAATQKLAQFGFSVSGWSRSPKRIDGVTCHHGPDGFSRALGSAEIFVTLLPDTPATENLLDTAAFAQMPRGAFLINPGRGPLIDDDALLAALDSGQLAGATLDVFRTEPLPKDHPFWAHPRVTVTPHIAAATRPATASRVIADNIFRSEAGDPLLHRVDTTRGY
ncbi:glyoxylate/hydroxypyruvate reductase A [Sulfitobacter sp. D35]|uniref:2-hydroxyacid dehydrogenase n=1 Tax=Sulfitobacter sp. D35 TaxID=3083252 RepID=UPI00296E9894|nr:glyoxylate/hydroxypyruvate reductase A [Sulfitobacter sp. D35]MDW4500126.1 glyoxylate/hydroxypyruvate reductase A [Sulfitobacter sp. D35]